MKHILLLCFFTSIIWSQQAIQFDTFLQYEYQKDSVKNSVIFLTSKEFPDFTLNVYNDAKKDSSKIILLKYDQVVCSNFIANSDFRNADRIILKGDYLAANLEINDYKFKHQYYEMSVLRKDSIFEYEIKPNLSQRKIKKKKIKIMQVSLLPNTSNEIMFNDGKVWKWLLQNQPTEFQGIPSKVLYLNPETRALYSTLTLIEKKEISKYVTIQNIQNIQK